MPVSITRNVLVIVEFKLLALTIGFSGSFPAELMPYLADVDILERERVAGNIAGG